MHNRRLQIAAGSRATQPHRRPGGKPHGREDSERGARWLRAFAAPPFIPATLVKSVDLKKEMQKPAKRKSYSKGESSLSAGENEGIAAECGRESARAPGHDPSTLIAALGLAYFASHAMAKFVSDKFDESKGMRAGMLAAPLVAAPLLLPEDAQAGPKDVQGYAAKAEQLPKLDMDDAPLAAAATAFIIVSIVLLAKEGSPKLGRGSRDKF